MAKKTRCTFKECRDVAQRIVGDCGFCHGHFCGKHRLLEDHKCSGLEDVSRSRPELSSDESTRVSEMMCSLSLCNLKPLSPRAGVSRKKHNRKHKKHALSVSPSTPRSPQWWLVGLHDTLENPELFADSTFSSIFSAKNSPTSRTLPNSLRSAPLSSRVFNETDYDDC
ncbi:hypothetical protein Cpir12675_001748 [Ceratocystis pirilliformis]|uniref:AN1-type domain-containing protein n=1 Tax=Ceratocystis pirilliformis TaxID=259994 RepID=A0ABR3ZEA9_9PEZI